MIKSIFFLLKCHFMVKYTIDSLNVLKVASVKTKKFIYPTTEKPITDHR